MWRLLLKLLFGATAVAQIITHTPSTWNFVKPETRFGVYVVQSEKNLSLYRVGSVGINSEKTRLISRLKLHASKASQGNWTVENRPWKLIWAAEIQSADDIAFGVLALEYALFAEFAKHFKVVKTSGFHATERENEIMQVIAQFHPIMEAIARVQF